MDFSVDSDRNVWLKPFHWGHIIYYPRLKSWAIENKTTNRLNRFSHQLQGVKIFIDDYAVFFGIKL